MTDHDGSPIADPPPPDPTLPATTATFGKDHPALPTLGYAGPTSRSAAGERFAPGTVIAGRYRLAARLGVGGMGEVYRAEDLKLGETVAVKFLPGRLEMDATALARFHREVRMSRQIAHRNVCRVFDIGEAEGRHFLTMEYIDGEDLASLLRRIGRLPADKAAQLSRQLCSGLAAAHEVGILHRDLKPANIMIDGRGRAKITDFGLSHLLDELQESQDWIGTPAYMAPEQLKREPVGVGTDLYAMGLVIYEMFTGTKPFEAEETFELLGRGRRAAPPVPPSDHVPTLEPSVEDLLLHLLADSPSDRPSSALEVALALPGGDPLAAALAAGETPSPEMVAAAPDRGLLSARLAAGGVAAVLLFLLIAHGLGGGTLLGMIPEIKEPAVLEDRARSLLRELGWNGRAVDRVGAYRFEDLRVERAEDALISAASRSAAWRARAEERPMLLTYWYRQAPRSLQPWQVAWTPEPFDPPPMHGEALVILDARGRLEHLRLEADLGPELWAPGGRAMAASGEADNALWAPLFAAAELDFQRFRNAGPVSGPVPEGWPPHDRRWAFVGEEQGGEALRIDAASLGSRPVLFVLSEGETPALVSVPPRGAEAPIPAGQELLMVTFFLLMGTALVLAYRHLHRERADRRGAGILGTFIAAVSFVGLIFGAHHPPTEDELFLLLEILEASAFRGAAVVLVYLALEPLIRRRAPEVLVTSTRVLVGRWQDPRVGRDLLAGLVMGTAAVVVCSAMNHFGLALGDHPLAIYGVSEKLAGLGGTLYWMSFSFFLEVSGSLLLCLLYALLVAWTKRRLLAGIGLWALATTLGGFSPIAMLGALLFVLSLAHFGLLTTIVGWMCIDWALFFPTGAGLDDWWLWRALLPSLLLAALAIVAARIATGTRILDRAAKGYSAWTGSGSHPRRFLRSSGRRLGAPGLPRD